MLDIKALDQIIKDTITVVEKSKEQIYDIAENARVEKQRVALELDDIQNKAVETIREVDELERSEKKARVRLMDVSRNFNRYTEKDIKEAYDHAREQQVKVGLLRERERQLRLRRNQLEISLRKLDETVNKAENMVGQVGVALNLLGGNLQGISDRLEEIQQRQNFGVQVIKAQEEERRRVARDIHDGPAQSMANVILRAEICEKLLDKNPAQVPKELRELKTVVKNSLQDVRKIIFDLRPMALDDLGIIPTLKRYFSEYQERNGINIDLVAFGQEKRISSGMEVAIFRVIQEAVNNVNKHSKAHKVLVRLEMTPKVVNCSIKDDGVGFDVKEKMDQDKFGLLGMRERVELLRGSFTINSAPEQGTEVKFNIPLEED